jgi:hypothetical protein
MVSKFDIGALALGAFAIFLIVRGGGQALANLGNPLSNVSLPEIPNPIEGITLPSIPNPFEGLFGGGDTRPPVVVGPIQPGTPSPDLIPTEEERLAGNQSIIEKLGLGPIPGIDRPLDLTQFASQIPQDTLSQSLNTNVQPVTNLASDAPAQGGGPSFIGGQINETPLENLSLNQIIENLGVSASQAANLQAFGDTPNISAAPDDPPQIFNNTSIPELSGQTPEEIFAALFPEIQSNF